MTLFSLICLFVLAFTGIIPVRTDTVQAAEVLGETTAYKCQKYSDLDSAINDGIYTGISGTFLDPKQDNLAAKKNLSAVYKVLLHEDGQVYAKYWVKSERNDNSFLDFTLYTDVNLTNVAIKKTNCNYQDTTRNQFVTLKKGTYYLEIKTDRIFQNEEINEKYGAYFGYVPKDVKFITFTLSNSKPTNKNVVVTVKVNEDCETLWKKAEITNDYYLEASTYWDTKDLLEKKEVTFTKNGDLTVRIKDVYGNVYMNSISVKNIDKIAPVKPTLKNYKANTTIVTGIAEKGSKVYAVIGSKSYHSTANSKTGAFSIKTPKLKKNTIIKIYCKDLAGNKSALSTIKVK